MRVICFVSVVFGNELEVVRLAPALEQILERLAQHTFALTAGHRTQPVQLAAIFVDQMLAQTHPHFGVGTVPSGERKVKASSRSEFVTSIRSLRACRPAGLPSLRHKDARCAPLSLCSAAASPSA
jgi:hypothetical protein